MRKNNIKFLITAFLFVLILGLAACGGGSENASGDSSADSGSSSSSNGGSSSGTSSSGGSSSGGDSGGNEGDSGWKPERDVEFVVPFSPGGGSDTNARTIVKVINDNGFAEGVNFTIVNKPGGSGAVGNTYVFNKGDDNHTIVTWVPGQATASIVNGADVSMEDLTPIGTLALDSFLLVVNANSPYKTLEEFVAAAKEKPGEIAIGGTAVGAEDHLVMYMLEKAADIDLKYVTFNSGGETTSALLGGHIDAVITNPNEIIGPIESGDAMALATSSKEALEEPFADIPTFASKGYGSVYYEQYRGIMGTPDMSPEAVAYYEALLKKVAESEDWKENYIKRNSLTPAFKGAEESDAFWTESLTTLTQLLDELGLLKK